MCNTFIILATLGYYFFIEGILHHNQFNHKNMDFVKEELVKKWKANKRYTLKILEAMPEAAYDFKPEEGMKTFISQASHIASWLSNHITKIEPIEMPKINKSGKAALITSIDIMFDHIIAYLQQMNVEILKEEIKMWYGKSSKLRILNLMDNHLSHHRGQMIVYLRLKGIKPPSYIGW